MPGAPNQTQRRSAHIRYANWGWSGYACGTSHLQRSHRSIAWNWSMGQWPMRVRIVQEVLALMRVADYLAAADPSALQPPGFIDFLPARIIAAFDHLPQGAHPLVISTKHQTIICPLIRHLTPFRKSDYFLGSMPVDVDDLAFWKRKDALPDLVIHLTSLTVPTKYNDSEISRPACNGKMEEGLAATASGIFGSTCQLVTCGSFGLVWTRLINGLVQSGSLPRKQATADRNRSRTNPDIEGTKPDHLGPVFCGPWTAFKLIQTGLFA
ncbi:uncharacterized protein LACBIDRAFT_328537 [Laccaria bicolor S238N-H82]|uniref:Predicted protein n=1 Tax=Laccaria bicolor (strain S238N-H82 / ATCC MYA-4686) TaxID=486041 RepID=B0DF71_LACBS|nr:uncharacterized protein LACBIDRAFT_328537 [Laccaria bicolor S238N-H82]EDR06661.1 predicted protein [Laccaria bicolor S238N-H82]|eukprot:XP_001882508.1 predicted protein [Laccaria bicolor S238N-H82]